MPLRDGHLTKVISCIRNSMLSYILQRKKQKQLPMKLLRQNLIFKRKSKGKNVKVVNWLRKLYQMRSKGNFEISSYNGRRTSRLEKVKNKLLRSLQRSMNDVGEELLLGGMLKRSRNSIKKKFMKREFKKSRLDLELRKSIEFLMRSSHFRKIIKMLRNTCIEYSID